MRFPRALLLSLSIFLPLRTVTCEKKLQQHLYRVVTAEEGGWKSSDVKDFEAGAPVLCHKNLTDCFAGEGVDWFSQERTEPCDVEEIEASLIRVKYDEESRLVPAECCETFRWDDTCIYATPQGLLHHATWQDSMILPENALRGMKIVEDSYGNQIRRRFDELPVLVLNFGYVEYDEKDEVLLVDINIPFRVTHSSRYEAPYYRSMKHKQVSLIADELELMKRSKDLGMNAKGGPFPLTYFSIPQALAEVDEPTMQFFIRSLPQHGYGTGLYASSLSHLGKLSQNSKVLDGSEYFIQEIIDDFDLILGHEFHIEFYILFHAGRVYMHQNAKILLEPLIQCDNSTKQYREWPESSPIGIETECIHSFLSIQSTGKERQWMESIFDTLITILPVLEPVIQATAADTDEKLYHIFSAKAMIRQNDKVLITSVLAWPIVDWLETDYGGDSCTSATKLSLEETYLAYEDSVSTMYGDFFAIVLGLANTTTTNDVESCSLLDGRVREVIDYQSASKATKIL